MAIEKRSYRNQGSTSQPMTVTAGSDGTAYYSFGYDDVAVHCSAIAGGTAQVQVSPVFSGDTWINHGAAFAAIGTLEVAKPSARIRVQLGGGATGTFYLVTEKR